MQTWCRKFNPLYYQTVEKTRSCLAYLTVHDRKNLTNLLYVSSKSVACIHVDSQTKKGMRQIWREIIDKECVFLK